MHACLAGVWWFAAVNGFIMWTATVPHKETSQIIIQEKSHNHTTHTHTHLIRLYQSCCGVFPVYCGVWVCNVGVCHAIKQQVCDLRCVRIHCSWHLCWLLHRKQDFSGNGWLKKTACELIADQGLKAGGVCYNWPTLLSTSKPSISVLAAQFGCCYTFSVSDLSLLRE